jgi:hypothetical protein
MFSHVLFSCICHLIFPCSLQKQCLDILSYISDNGHVEHNRDIMSEPLLYAIESH